MALATTANTTANNAVTLNTTPIAINQRLSPSATAFQVIRTNGAANGVEWFSPKDVYAKITEIYAKGTDNPTAPSVGKNIRLLNNIDNNFGAATGVPLTLNALTGVISLHLLGVYRIRAWAIINRSGASALNHQLLVVKDLSNATFLTGSSFSLANGNTNNVMATVEGLLNCAAVGDLNIRLDHYTSTATGIVLGKAANVHPDVGGNEIYSGIEIEFLGV